MSRKKYLIIGCNGFIGLHLTNYLNESGCEVAGADINANFNKALTHNKYFELNTEKMNYDFIFANQDFDFCINCSGAASVPNSLNNPLFDFELNSLNVFKILNSIRLYNPSCNFINLSSAAVYGNPSSLPVSEKDSVHPISPYGIHKYMSEEICREFHVNFRLNTCSLRIFSAFGEGLRKQFFWDLFHRMKGAEGEIELYGTGKETRDFIYINDLVKAIELVSLNSNFKADVINIANGVEIEIVEAATIFKSFLGFNGEIVFNGNFREGDPLNWCADISKLISFGYKSSFSLQTGIENYINWIRNIKN